MTIGAHVDRLGSGALTESALTQHIWPLFSRVLRRDEIYLANHSLGRPLDQTAEDVRDAIDLWYERLDGAWEDDGWPAEMQRFRAAIGRLIGSAEASCVVPKTSAGQGLRAVLNALPRDRVSVVATRGEFDSLDFILKAYQKRGRTAVRWVEPKPSAVETAPALFDEADVVGAIQPGVDLVVVSLVVFGTGQVLELGEIIRRAHEAGALVLVDAYHAAGVIPVDMMGLDCDFMVGGSYKYTRGGPGACWLAIHPRVLESNLRTLDTGWFAKEAPFSYARPDDPRYAHGGDAWLESTPPVLTFYQARAGLELTLAIGVDRLRTYGLAQLSALREAFSRNDVPFFDPPQPDRFGAFALAPHTRAKEMCEALRGAGVNTDTRGGNIRFGPDILNTVEELDRAAEVFSKTHVQ